MNRRIAVAILAVASTLPVFAHGPGPGGRINFLAGALSLTDTQKEQAKAIFDAAAQASETLHGEMATARANLNSAVKANAAETQIDTLAAAIGTIESRLIAIHAKAQAKFYALLTAEQKSKFDALGEHRGPGRGPGPGMAGPRQ